MNKPLIDQTDIWVTEGFIAVANKDEILLEECDVLNEKVSHGIRYLREMESHLMRIKQQIKTGQMTKEQWGDAATEMTLAAERLSNHCRGMMIDAHKNAYSNGTEELDELLLTQSDIRIGITDQGWFYLRMPAILPHKKRGHNWYLEGILWAAFRRWQRKKIELGEPIKPFREKCVIIYRTTYDRLMPARRLTDFDNFEYKIVTDMIAGPLLVDDGPKYLDAHYMANIAGDCEFTEVFLVPERDYIACYRILKESLPLIIRYQFCS